MGEGINDRTEHLELVVKFRRARCEREFVEVDISLELRLGVAEVGSLIIS